ncbi:PQQ-like beta-propeller repeat protein [Rubripirellula amarantea]|uniref:Outer membrane protein assembly factor BamB n=1 Tax=Rubripirellula amarantea TaxID=2527999 RepID=A0A5C5WUI0_9BACT|nr:PQQ-binding-like beta-propeller repeat protein [Rubripirellula amarantea]MDA8744680.1 PQQ-like beta-propeller repeat protein [Rubripirellula amarantea]TWT54397.1 Outer membrane protein assembly factor BamB [Rubripirellula amarantea]
MNRITGTAFTILLFAVAYPATAWADWPRFLNSTFDGQASKNSEMSEDSEPEFAWSLDVGDGYGLGSIVDGKYLHFDSVEDPKSTSARSGQILERLRMVDIVDGKEIWSQTMPTVYRDMFGYEAGPRSTPSVDTEAKRVYTMGVTGILACRNLDDGTLIWSVDTASDYKVVQNFFGVGTSPLILDDAVMVMVGGSPVEDADIPPMQLDRVSPAGSALVAFDKATGKEAWRCGDDLASYSNPRPILINGQTYVLLFARNGLLLIDPRSGTQQWRFEFRADMLESVNAMMPVVRGDEVLISECYQVGSTLLRATVDSPRVLWQDPPRDRRRQAMRCHWATPILINGFAYGCSGRNAPDSDFRCIEWSTGKVKWADERRIRSSVTRVGDKLVLLEERGLLQLIDPNPDQLTEIAQWDLSKPAGNRPSIGYPCWAAPIVDNNRMLVRGDTKVVCLTW